MQWKLLWSISCWTRKSKVQTQSDITRLFRVMMQTTWKILNLGVHLNVLQICGRCCWSTLVFLVASSVTLLSFLLTYYRSRPNFNYKGIHIYILNWKIKSCLVKSKTDTNICIYIRIYQCIKQKWHQFLVSKKIQLWTSHHGKWWLHLRCHLVSGGFRGRFLWGL